MRQLLSISLLLGLASAGAALASDVMGQEEYAASCAGCHGATGDGDGPILEALNVTAPPLGSISARNGGTFPFLDILMKVDGREGVRLHGSPMPIWGDRFKIDASDAETPREAEIEARGRLLSLVLYLESIQN